MWTTIVLLTLSNVFMTFAWYGHLKHKAILTLPVAILISWLIAFVEYCFQVPANRIGSDSGFSTPQLKILQEVITLAVFSVFSVWYLNERPRWNDVVGFLFILGAVYFVFAFDAPKTSPERPVAARAAELPGG
ncbi:MAG: DMT family protein [Planctomyces sp.]|nr:DMT family protein [Planctomyces sp.]